MVLGICICVHPTMEKKMALLDEVHEILDPGVDKIEEGKHPDIGDAMNLLGRVVAAVEHIAQRIDEQSAGRS